MHSKIRDVGSVGIMVYFHTVDGVMARFEPVLQRVSSHRLCPSAPWWTHRRDLSAGPAGRDSEVRMPWITG